MDFDQCCSSLLFVDFEKKTNLFEGGKSIPVSTGYLLGLGELVSEVKQKLLEKLKKIVRKRESFRKKRRFKRVSSRMFSFPSDKYKALEEVREILGFSEEELGAFLGFLEKADGGYLDFDCGDILIEFHICACDSSSPDEIDVLVKVKEKEITHTAEYEFKHGLQNLSKWKKRL